MKLESDIKVKEGAQEIRIRDSLAKLNKYIKIRYIRINHIVEPNMDLHNQWETKEKLIRPKRTNNSFKTLK